MKKNFLKKKIFWAKFLSFYCFFYKSKQRELPKNIFGFLPSFDQNILKMIFEHMSCAKPYSYHF